MIPQHSEAQVLQSYHTDFILLSLFLTVSSLCVSEKGEEWEWEVADGAAPGQRVGAASVEDGDGDQPRYR